MDGQSNDDDILKRKINDLLDRLSSEKIEKLSLEIIVLIEQYAHNKDKFVMILNLLIKRSLNESQFGWLYIHLFMDIKQKFSSLIKKWNLNKILTKNLDLIRKNSEK